MGPREQTPSFKEFVTLMALMMSLVALSIDGMLPALPQIAQDLGAETENARQHIVTVLFLGMSVSMMVFGPISDSIGRKPAIQLGFAIFILGCLVSLFAVNMPMMLAGRILQGFGAAAPRIVTVAMIRDLHEGRAMARVMSLVMLVFILVPMLAPAVGQGIMLVADWRAIFGLFLGLALFLSAWLALRQPETLPPERRARFSLKHVGAAIRETIASRIAFGYTLSAGFVFGAFVGYLNSAQQILQELYGLGDRFALAFGALAISFAAASFVNARLVMRLGMRPLSRIAVCAISLISLAFLPFAWLSEGAPDFWMLWVYLTVSFFCIGILFANFNALALQPLGHIAGVASAVVGALSTLMALSLGALIGQAYDGTILPLVAGFAFLGLVSLATMAWTERARPPASDPVGVP
jgi:DHA1 family bicyclomycin/chloramphenicol resistance-like MFS transporter